jgi:nucleotide-binding universal stress UspA family protein
MLLMGDPTEAIVRLAKTECADFIVMGTHGRTGLSRIFLGSVAEAVVRRAPCPVLIARHPAPLEVLAAS